MTAAIDLVIPRPGDTFYDSASYEFPEHAEAITEYADGPNTWARVRGPKPTARETYPHVHSITIKGGAEQLEARALILDYEQHLASYSGPGARDWAEARIMDARRAVFYCGRANLHRLRGAVGPMIWTSQRVWFWIPTLDGVQWSAQILAEDIAMHWGVAIPAGRIWANQNRGTEQTGGPWDASTLLGQW